MRRRLAKASRCPRRRDEFWLVPAAAAAAEGTMALVGGIEQMIMGGIALLCIAGALFVVVRQAYRVKEKDQPATPIIPVSSASSEAVELTAAA